MAQSDLLRNSLNPIANTFDNNKLIELPDPKEDLLRSDMMKKLSLKEKWLHENGNGGKNIVEDNKELSPPMEVDDLKTLDKKNKRSFLNGIFSSLTNLIKPSECGAPEMKPEPKKNSVVKVSKLEPPKKLSSSPPKVDINQLVSSEDRLECMDEVDLEELVQEKTINKKKKRGSIKKQKSEDIREEADSILKEIKDGNEKLAKQMREMESKKFSDNMQSIKSSVVDSKVASMKERNLTKYFPNQEAKKPLQVAKNKDVKALKDVNLSKYFPASPASTRKNPGTPNAPSTAASSANASPLTPRKNLSEVNLTNYFPATPVLTRKAIKTPPTTPQTEKKSIVELISPVSSIAPPPPPPIAKKNILSMQTVKKRALPVSNENKAFNDNKTSPKSSFKLGEIKPKNKSPTKIPVKKSLVKEDDQLFDQLLDGAIDLNKVDGKEKEIVKVAGKEVAVDNFDSLMDDVRLERSPSKEYAQLFDDGIKNLTDKPAQEVVKKKSKSKSPKKTKAPVVTEPEVFDKMFIDPKFMKALSDEYQRLVVEHEKNSKSKSPETFENNERKQSIHEKDEDFKMEEIVVKTSSRKSSKQESLEKNEIKRKSPQRNDDLKKFKDSEDIAVISQENPIDEDNSVRARLQRKYKRLSSNDGSETPSTPPVDSPMEEEKSYNFEKFERKLSVHKQDLAVEMAEPIGSTQKLKNFEKLSIKESIPMEVKKIEKKPREEPAKRPTDLALFDLPREHATESFDVLSKTQCGLVAAPMSERKIDQLFDLPKENLNNLFKEISISDKPTGTLPKQESPRGSKKSKGPRESKEIKEQKEQPKKDGFASIFSLPRESLEDPFIEIEQAKLEMIQMKMKPPRKEQKAVEREVALIDFGIVERPFSENMFTRQDSTNSKDSVPYSLDDAPSSKKTGSRKSSASSDDLKNAKSLLKDSAYSDENFDMTSSKTSEQFEFNSRKNSKGEDDIKDNFNDKSIVSRKSSLTTEHANILKDISSTLIGFDSAVMIPQSRTVQNEPPKKQIASAYSNVLKDISSNLVGLDLYGVECKKSYAQKIPAPPHYNAQLSNTSDFSRSRENLNKLKPATSSNTLNVPVEPPRFDYSDDKVTDIKIPVPRISVTPDLPRRTKKPLLTSKSFDFDDGDNNKYSDYYEYKPSEYKPHLHNTIYHLTNDNHAVKDVNRRRDFDSYSTIPSEARALDKYDLHVGSRYSREYDYNPNRTSRQPPLDLGRDYILDKYDLGGRRTNLSSYNFDKPIYGHSEVESLSRRPLTYSGYEKPVYHVDEVKRYSDYKRPEEEISNAEASHLLEKSHQLHQKKENFMRGQASETNPYIREMMKQDVDNPISISDIKSIRNQTFTPSSPPVKHTKMSALLAAKSSVQSTYVPTNRTPVLSRSTQSTLPSRSISSMPARSSTALPARQIVPTSSYVRAAPPLSTYVPSSTSTYTPYRHPNSSATSAYHYPVTTTASHIMARAMGSTTQSYVNPHNSHVTSSYQYSHAAPTGEIHRPSSSRVMSYLRKNPTASSHSKSSRHLTGKDKEACTIS